MMNAFSFTACKMKYFFPVSFLFYRNKKAGKEFISGISSFRFINYNYMGNHMGIMGNI